MFARPFVVPYIAGANYVAGAQPYSPGEPNAFWKQSDLGMADDPKPWPGAVGVLNVNLGFAGYAQARAVIPQVNEYAPNPSNYLFLSGVVQKSQG